MIRLLNTIDKSKKHFVAWSGGCDSSLLLYDLCEALGKDNPPIALSYEAFFLDENKVKLEKEYRAKFKKELEENRDLHFIYHTMTTSISIDQDSDPKWGWQGLAQPVLFLLQFLPIMPNDAVLHFGYLKSDDFGVLKHEFNKMIYYINKIMNKNINIIFDFEFITKIHILRKIDKLNLNSFVSFCESPSEDGKICGCCGPCTSHYTAIIYDALSSMAVDERINIIHQIKNKEEIINVVNN